MLMRRHALTLLSAAALALITHAAPAHARQVCKPMVWGNGQHANQNIAKIHALGAWKSNAKSQHGAAFGNYAAAKSKSQICRKEGPVRASGKYKCVIKGRPCATVRGQSGKESG
jgi:hypothetical protein